MDNSKDKNKERLANKLRLWLDLDVRIISNCDILKMMKGSRMEKKAILAIEWIDFKNGLKEALI